MQLITGRTLYHFHTRTKTGRAPQLQAAAPDVWVEVSARRRRHAAASPEGDLLRGGHARAGPVQARLRVSGIRAGVVFLPFHYGYWDTPAGTSLTAHGRAANELTITDWDPASKQPIFKTAAARISKVRSGDGPAPAPTNTASAPAGDFPAEARTRGIPSALADEEIPGQGTHGPADGHGGSGTDEREA